MAVEIATGVVDCDIHNQAASLSVLKPYLAEGPRRRLERFGSRSRHGLAQGYPYPKATPNAARVDAWPPDGGPPGSNLGFVRQQHLDTLGLAFGILNCLHGGANEIDPALGSAMCRAVNDWQRAEWLEPETRLRGSIVIPQERGVLPSRHPGGRPLRRVRWQPDHVVGLAVVLPRGPHWHVGRVPGAARFARVRGCAGPVPGPADRLHRGRSGVAAVARVANGAPVR